MAQKLQIEVEANLSGYTASLKEAAQENVELSDSAIKSAATVSKAYAEVGKVQRAAFGGEETKKALANQNAELVTLRQSLDKLYKEEVRLISSGKQLTDEYKKNREEAARVRAEFDKVNASLRGNVSATEKVEQKVITTTVKLKNLREELRTLELAGKQNTKEFENLAVSAAKLQDQVGKTDDRIKALASDTFVFDAAIDSVSALAGGFAVAQGAIGLFAEDNEELQQAIAKTNSALAILNGLQQVQAFVTGQSAGKLGIITLAQNAYSLAVGTATGAMKIFRLALIATGIGAAVVAIGFLVENFGKLKEAAFSVIPGLRDVAGFIGTVIDKAKELLGVTDKDSDDALARFVKNEQRKLDFQLNAISRQIDLQKALGRDTTNLEIQREQVQLAFAKRRLDLIKTNEDAIRAANIDTTQIIFDLEQEVLDRRNAIAILEINLTRDKFKAINLETRQGFIQITQTQKQFFDEFAKQSIDSQRTFESSLASVRTARLNAETKLVGEEENITKEGLRNRLTAIGLYYFEQQIIAANSIKDEKERIAAIQKLVVEGEKAKSDEIKKTRETAANQAAELLQAFSTAFSSIFALTNQLRENQISELNEQEQRELDSAGNNARKRAQIEEKFAKERRKLEREQAVAQKNQAIFLAVINTSVAIIKALTTGGVIGPALAAAAAIAGAAQIATIAATPLPKLERGGRIGGRRHVQGGTIIEAEKDEFVVSRTPAIKHGRELEAMNRSSREYMSLIDKTYVRPAVMDAILTVRREDSKFNVNAKLDARNIESELRTMRRENKKGNKQLQSALASKSNSRYSW